MNKTQMKSIDLLFVYVFGLIEYEFVERIIRHPCCYINSKVERVRKNVINKKSRKRTKNELSLVGLLFGT